MKNWLDSNMGESLVKVNTLLLVAPLLFLLLMRMKGQSLGWFDTVLLLSASLGVACVVALGIARVGHTALTLQDQPWARGMLFLSWLSLSFLLVSAVTVVFVMVSSKQEYLKVIQPEYITSNWPNFVACFLLSIMADATILAVMYSDAVKSREERANELREMEASKDAVTIERNAAQTELQQTLGQLETLRTENENLSAQVKRLNDEVTDLHLAAIEGN